MNQCVMPRQDFLSSQRAFRYQVSKPQTCSTEKDKVANLRALVRDAEAQIREVERLSDKLEFLATGELVAALVMETSIGFLDLAASAFSSINPAAAKYAKAGVTAIESSGSIAQAVSGQKSYGQAFSEVGDKSVDLTFSLAGSSKNASLGKKALLNTAKAHYDTAVIGIKSAMGTSEEEIRKDGIQFLKDRSGSTAGLIADGLKESDLTKTGNTLSSLVIVGEMYDSAMRYETALNQRFDNYLAARENDQTWVMNAKMNLRSLLTNLQNKLNKAVSDLEACELQG
ncbi:hypothetical protein [Nereida sp. MMG025]|uniref:hypothetical protein n=1 Tax=Nereida sp. MMG025 TaxID=2909981 RepID=UPI001F353497|nr:hypothetical protein [Nereida sp. MMG025]MCF6445706.1 hypothetical protein [Nereida sp. MMG025]